MFSGLFCDIVFVSSREDLQLPQVEYKPKKSRPSSPCSVVATPAEGNKEKKIKSCLYCAVLAIRRERKGSYYIGLYIYIYYICVSMSKRSMGLLFLAKWDFMSLYMLAVEHNDT